MEGPETPPSFANYQRSYGVGPHGPAPGRVRFEVINEAWNVLKADWGTWIGAVLVAGIIGAVVGIPATAYVLIRTAMSAGAARPPDVLPVTVIITLFTSSIAYAFVAGVLNLCLTGIRRTQVSFADMFAFRGRFGTIFTAGLLVNLVMVPISQSISLTPMSTTTPSQSDPFTPFVQSMPYLLVILVAITCVSVLTIFVPLLVLDKGLSPTEAVKTSISTALPRFFSIFGLIFVAGLIGISGIIACGIGVLFTAPLPYLVQAALYNDFFRESGGTDFVTSDPNMMNPPTIGSL